MAKSKINIDRLRERMVAVGQAPEKGGQTWLAKKIGMSQQGVQSILAGDSDRPRLLREIAEAIQTNEAYLLDESDDPRPSKPGLVNSYDPDADMAGADPDIGAAVVNGELHYRRRFDGGSPETNAKPGAGLGTDDGIDIGVGSKGIATGHEVIDEWVIPPSYVRHALNAHPAQILIMPVVGHSMEPRLESNDRVLVDVSQNMWMGDAIYVINVFGSAALQVKTVRIVQGTNPPLFRIISEASPTMEDPPLRGDQFKIVGRVVGRVSKM